MAKATKKAATNRTAAKKTTPKKSAAKKTAPKKTAAKKTAIKKGAPKKAATKKTSSKKAAPKNGTAQKNKNGVKNSLVNNINAKKKKGTSKPRSKSTISKEAYDDMENNWDKKKKK
jgi:hypothetical protein